MAIPKLTGHWFWGSLGAFLKEPYAFPGKVAGEAGGITRFRLLHRKFIAVNHPDLYDQIMVRNAEAYERSYHFKFQQVLFGKGMITTDGPEWAAKRGRGAPAFTRDSLKKVAPQNAKTAAHFLDGWDKAADAGESIPLMSEMQKLTISIICKSLFSVDMDHASTAQFCDAARESASIIRIQNATLLRLPLWAPTKTNAQLLKTRQSITDFVLDKIEKRKMSRQPGEARDILGVLLNGREMKDLEKEEYEDILDECKTILLAGFETTALTLSWALYLLATHPEAAVKWHDECDRLVAEDDPSREGLEKLAYTRQVCYETMRLYPVVFTQPRVCVKNTKLGEHAVKKGELLLLSIYGMQRSSDYWDDPHTFNPDRFARDKTYPQKSYMPFGKGKHTCLGNHFAVYEMLAILSMIGKRFNLKRADDAPVGIRSTLLLMPDKEIPLFLKRRP